MKRRRLYLLLRSMLLLVVFAGVGAANRAAAQVPVIEYTNAGDVTKSYGTGAFVLKITFGGSCSGTQIAVELPTGVTYTGGLATTTNTTPSSISIVHNASASTPSKPVFNVSGSIAAGSVLEFTFDRSADCNAVQGSAFDKTFVTFSGGCTEASVEALNENGAKGYSVLEAALSITPPPAITGQVVGNTIDRVVTVTNGGLGATDRLFFSITYPIGAIENRNGGEIQVACGSGSGVFSPVTSNGNTFFYEIFGPALFDGNSILENGENVQITEPLIIRQCGTPNINTDYTASWGQQGSSFCQTAHSSSQISFATGTANFSAATVERRNFTNLCQPFELAFTITNGGAGNAKAAGMYNLKIRHGNSASSIQAGPYNVDWDWFEYSNVRINGVSVSNDRVALVDGANHTSGTKVQEIDLHDLFTDGASGLEDLDGDGFFDDLPGGKTLAITMDVTMKETACGQQYAHSGHGLKLFYNNMCGADIASEVRAASGSGISFNGTSNGIAHIPANVQNGEIFTFSAKAAWSQYSNALATNNSRWRWKIELPAGFTVASTPNARYGTTSVANGTGQGQWTIQNGNTIVFTSAANRAQAENFFIDLQFNCDPSSASGGSKDFTYSLERVNDITASPECALQGSLFCETITTVAKCPEPCDGILPDKPIVRRTTLGFTDNTMTARQTRENISAYDLSKALYLDEIEIEGNATISESFSLDNLYIYLDLPKTASSSPVSKLKPLRVSAEIVRDGTPLPLGEITVADESTVVDESSSTATTQIIRWNLTSLVADEIQSGDVIRTKSYYQVATNDGLPREDIQSGGNWYFYSLDANDTETGICDSWIPEMYLVGTQTDNGVNAFTTTGCVTTTIGGNTWNLARRMSAAGQQFETEFRPAFYIDKVEIDLPLTYVLNEASLVSNTPLATGTSLGTSKTISNLVPSSTSGSLRVYDNPNDGSWNLFNITTINNYGGNFLLRVTPTCATAPQTNTNVKVHIRDFYYAYAEVGGASNPTPAPDGFSYVLRSGSTANEGNFEPNGQTRPINYSASGRPTLQLQNLTGTITATEEEHEWTLSIGNTGTSNAPYTWIAIPDHAGVTVTEVRRSDNTVVAPIAYSGGKMYHLEESPGIPQGSSRLYRIKFNYTSCDPADLKVFAGWNCGSFPSNPDEYVCNKEEIDLRVEPQISQVQLIVSRQPGGAAGPGEVEMCENAFTDIIVNSAQAAYLINPTVEFDAPSGIILPSTVAVEYPLGGAVEYLPLTNLAGNLYRVDLSNHSGIGEAGIPGTANATNNAARQAKVTIGQFEISCDFASGTLFRFRGYGDQPCGAPANQNGVTTATDPLHITGVPRTGSASLQLSFDGVTSLTCDQEITLRSNITPVGANSEASDFIEYTLPSGLEYVDGSISSGLNVSLTGNKLRVNLPETAANTAANISFNLRSTDGEAFCGNVQVFADYHRVVEGLSCGTSSCAGSSRIISNGFSEELSIQKPEFKIQSVPITSGSPSPGSSYTASFTLINTGTVDALANTYIIEAFCGTSTTPFDAQLIPAGVAASATEITSVTFEVPEAPICNSGDAVIYRIRPMTETGETQCLCAPTEFISNDPLPVTLAKFEVSLSEGRSVTLDWLTTSETNSSYFGIERSVDSKKWLPIGDVEARSNSSQNQNYSFIDPTPTQGVNYYRLKMTDLDGSFEYSPIQSIKVATSLATRLYPNPVSEWLILDTYKQNVAKVELMDINGKTVYQSDAASDIRVAALSAGTYILRISYRDGSNEVLRVIKK